TGCGTSEHGALARVEILADALDAVGLGGAPGAVAAAQAFEASLAPQRGGLLVGVSHEGGTTATNAALAAGRAAGARTALVTVGAGSPGAALADIVVATGEMDQSWCHTIGYLSPLLAASAVGAALTGGDPQPVLVRALLAAGLASDVLTAAEAAAGALARVDRLIVAASGADRPAGRELALKVEEASYLPTVARDLETWLHGHLPATDAATGLVVVSTERRARPARVERMVALLRAAEAIGMPVVAVASEGAAEGLPAGLTGAGRIVVPEAASLPAPVAALLATAVPLQLLTERLARARGTNPDTLRRHEAIYLEAGERHG
ncbi:MAG TPA: SIS domain-containing protein, partial [Candidatus Limnocylindrales bacterium]|nr:SIS domain-containing protein [Candidatus Limnocylindrales bacterium]